MVASAGLFGVADNRRPVCIGACLVVQFQMNEAALEKCLEVAGSHFDSAVCVDQRSTRMAERPVCGRAQQQGFEGKRIDGERFCRVGAGAFPLAGNSLHARPAGIVDGFAGHPCYGVVIGANGILGIAGDSEGITRLPIDFGTHRIVRAGEPFCEFEECSAGICGAVELHKRQRLAVKPACRVLATLELQCLRHVERAHRVTLGQGKTGVIVNLAVGRAPLRQGAAGCEDEEDESNGEMFHATETCPAAPILQGKNGQTMSTGKRLFCFGCGYSARVFAARFRASGGSVAGTCRTIGKAAPLREMGIETHLFGDDAPLADAAAVLSGTTHLLISTPPGEKSDPVLAAHEEDLRRIASNVEWAGYLSTTGVYGDRQGGWVNEDTPLDPVVARSDRRAKAEEAWRGLAESSGLPLHIFRLAGIYGPGRNQLAGVIDGTARRIVKEGQIFSRIHVEDIANVLVASIAHPNPGAVYNVCDDEPAPAADVVAYAAELLGRAPPPEIPFEMADLSPMGRSFYMSSRRVSNRRIHDELGVTLAYPTYREGLKSLLGTL